MPVPADQRNPHESEDCLFLDVIVPDTIFNNQATNSSKGAAVIVYIFGGGYTGGSKTSSGNPAGLIYNSRAGGSDGIIYVGINYRVRLPTSLYYLLNFTSPHHEFLDRTVTFAAF